MSEDVSDDASDWARPLWVPDAGPETDAFVWFVVFNTEADDLSVEPEQYRVSEIPEGVDVFDVDEAFVESVFTPPMGDVLRERDPLVAAMAETADRAILITGSVEDPATLGYLRDVIGIVTAALDTGGVAVLSLQSLRLFHPEEWRSLVFDGGMDAPHHLVSILYSAEEGDAAAADDGGTLWVHTRGLRLFGRPDLSLHGLPAELLEPARALFRALIERLARGLAVSTEAVMDLGPPYGELHFVPRGDLIDPEFNNVHLEIAWRPPTDA